MDCNCKTPRCPECTQSMRKAWGFPNHRGAMKWICPHHCENITVYTNVITGNTMDSIDALAGQGGNKVYVR